MSNMVESTRTRCYKIGVSFPTVDATTNQISSHIFSSAGRVNDEETTRNLRKMFLLDFPEEMNSEQQAMSREDLQFIKIMKDNVTKVEGHYQLPLPFKESTPTILNNRKSALQRLASVKNKMLKDHKFREEYTNSVNDLIKKKYAVKTLPKTNHGTSRISAFATQRRKSSELFLTAVLYTAKYA